ncbi:hypothetical protein OAF00_01555 [bacterium]|nr:hypothetical protein [bacterium]
MYRYTNLQDRPEILLLDPVDQHQSSLQSEVLLHWNWDKHHSRYGADIELRNHAAFDFSKYNKFKTAFIEFAQQLTAASSVNTQVITRARRDAIHYWLRGASELKKPTDYIDLGHFSLVLADSITEGGLKNACLNLAASINDMVISKSTGNSRKDSLGLSIYYPYSGNISWNYSGLNFFKEEYGVKFR